MDWLLSDVTPYISVQEAARFLLGVAGMLYSATLFWRSRQEQTLATQRSTRLAAVLSMRNMLGIVLVQGCMVAQALNVMTVANVQQRSHAALLNGATAFLTSLVLVVIVAWGRRDRTRIIDARLEERAQGGIP